MGIRGTPPVLILGGGETGLGLLRAFTARRIPTFVYAPPGDLTRHSRWFRAAAVRPGLGLHDLLQRLPLERAVLCPTSDHTAEALASLPGEFRDRFHTCLPRPEVLRDFVDKGRFATLLDAMGVPAPYTKRLVAEEDLDVVPDEVVPRLILKPCDSISFQARLGVKALWARSRAEARRQFRELQALGLRVVAQEYIPGGPEECYLIDGFVDLRGRTRALLARRKVRIYPADFGNPCYQVSVPLADVRPAVNDVLRLLTGAGYRGVFSALVKRDWRDGVFKILEVNARPYWFIDFTRRCGIDLAWMSYRDALGEVVPEAPAYQVGRRCMYPYYDLQRVRSGHCRLGRWLVDLLGAWQPVFRWDDPMPALAAGLAIARQRSAHPLQFARRFLAGIASQHGIARTEATSGALVAEMGRD